MATRARRAEPRIKDNKLTVMGEWDEAALRAEIARLLADDFDLILRGVSDDDFDALRHDPGAPDPDRPD